MFEKEGKKYASDLELIYKKGVLDGYDKGFKEGLKQKVNITTISDCPIKDEWHYVEDNLPDHNGQFYVALKGHTETFILNYDYDEYDESKMVWLDDDDTNFDDEVYAWREKLKAPKEIE